jgi:UDP-2-acetamido-3-amino-2,3-dideoxy-glucuronate N-acetyltransferase
MIHPTSIVETESIGENTRIWQYCVILYGAKIGAFCNINCHVLIEGNTEIGNNVTIKPGVQIWDGITIEDNVFIGPNVTFTNDLYPISGNSNFKIQNTRIGQGSSIGANTTILPGISIGRNVMIGAGSLITKNIPDNEIWFGHPAKFIRKND